MLRTIRDSTHFEHDFAQMCRRPEKNGRIKFRNHFWTLFQTKYFCRGNVWSNCQVSKKLLDGKQHSKGLKEPLLLLLFLLSKKCFNWTKYVPIIFYTDMKFFSGTLWFELPCVVLCGLVWLCVTLSGFLWPYVAICGLVSPFVAVWRYEAFNDMIFISQNHFSLREPIFTPHID